MKKHTKRLMAGALVMLTSVTMTGCKSEKIEYAELSAIYDDVDKALSQTYVNMEMPKEITIDEVDSLYKYTTKTYDKANDEKKKQHLSDFVTEIYGSCDESSILHWDDGGPDYFYYDNENFLARADEYNGEFDFWAYSVDKEYDTFFNLQVIDHYCVDRGDSIEGIEYTLNGQSYALTDAKAYADDLVNNKLLKFTGYDEARLKTAIVCKTDEENQQYALQYEFLVNGAPVDSTGDSHGDDHFMLTPNLTVEIAEPNTLLGASSNNTFEFGEPKKLKNSFVTLSSALKLAEKYLAEEHTYKVTDIEMQYSCIADWKTSPYEYHPFWRIVLKEEEKGLYTMIPQISLYVDMVTGKIVVYDMIDGSMDDFRQ